MISIQTSYLGEARSPLVKVITAIICVYSCKDAIAYTNIVSLDRAKGSSATTNFGFVAQLIQKLDKLLGVVALNFNRVFLNRATSTALGFQLFQ